MTINSRNKGASFEREVAKRIWEELGIEVKRNLDQYQAAGNYDLAGMPGWAIECKRYRTAKAADKANWWYQALAQAIKTGEEPVVIYKLDRQEIRCLFAPDEYFDKKEMAGVIDTSFLYWAAVVRERM